MDELPQSFEGGIIVKKVIIFGFALMFMIISSSGCIYENNTENKERLMAYAVEKYGGDYTEMYYQRAVDRTRSYDLCLKDSKGRLFNVSEDAGSGFQYDDYLESIIDYKMRNYLIEYLGEMVNDFNISAMTSMNVFTDLETLEQMTIEKCIEEFGLSSLIFVCHFDESKGNIEEKSEELVEIYKKLCGIDTNVINFNVVVTTGDNSEVKQVLENMRGLYTCCWYNFKGVQEFISDALTPINSVEDLLSLVKEG